MCGNGARCFARYVRRLTGIEKDFRFKTRAGVISARFNRRDRTVNLTAPQDLRLREKVRSEPSVLRKFIPSTRAFRTRSFFVPDADKAMVQPLGAEFDFIPISRRAAQT